ncbi:MAG: VWA domain-containing protein [Candidatus Eisenbacteria bacterium]|nr:VWA domain-containing protein [Candidatus Eisenbacteria bacterium]
MTDGTNLEGLRAHWMAQWPKALGAWSRFTHLRPPMLCLDRDAAKREGLSGSFAMIRLDDQAVVVDLTQVATLGLQEYAVEILAHEIGHHVLAPASLTDHVKQIARMRWALPSIEQQAGMVANLYDDLLINDRLQRSAGLRMDAIYRKLSGGAHGAVWTLYMRIYEILWSLERGSLAGGETDDRLEGDAILGARLIRSYARDWLDGAGRFAALLLPHLLEDRKSAELIAQWHDTQHAAKGGDPAGLSEEDAGERDGAIHPARDPDLNDLAPDDAGSPAETIPAQPGGVGQGRGQSREPYVYGEILRAAGVRIDDHEAAVRYYREQALKHLVRFPTRRQPSGSDPLPEGLEPWDIGHALDDADWVQSVLQSPRVIPGMTTVRRVWGTTEGKEPRRLPIDLDLYVDSSGSMADPSRMISFPALAGAILCLSALRAGASVRATLWSGKSQVQETDGFVRDERALLGVITAYFGGGTNFPIHRLRETYAKRGKEARPVHILLISDDGISTMFETDERGNDGWTVSVDALRAAGGGGTMVLNLPENWEMSAPEGAPHALIRRAREEGGWGVHRVASWEDLIAFAAEFGRRNYGPVPESARTGAGED